MSLDQSRKAQRLEAVKADAELRRVAAGAGALALALGDTLRELFDTGRLSELHCSREKDYMRERLGIPPRTGYQFLKLSRETKGKDLLRRAILCGAVTPNKALAIARVCSIELQSAWVDLAMKVGLADLVKRVKDSGGEPVAEEVAGGRILVEMTGEERAIYEKAVELARDLLGPGTPRWVAQESIAWEWLGEHGEVLLAAEAAAPGEPPSEPVPEALRAWTDAREEVERELRTLEEASRLVVEGPDPFCREPQALHARARRLAWTREHLTEPLGAMLRAFRDAGHWSVLGYDDFEEYARDRLGLSPRTVRERIWLARRLETRPEVREALRTGKISYAKALALARTVRPKDPDGKEKVEKAAEQPAEKVERDAEAEEARRDRALGLLRLWGPAQAMESIRESIESAQAFLATTATPAGSDEAAAPAQPVRKGRALAATGASFLEIWKEEDRRKRRPRARQAVLARKDGLCQVPGCTNPIAHLHHVLFRSAGGQDEVTNLLGVCLGCHLAIHAGLIRLWGLAGRRLVFEFRNAKDRKVVLERWVTKGADDTRRVAAGALAGAPVGAPAGASAGEGAGEGRGEAVGVSEGSRKGLGREAGATPSRAERSRACWQRVVPAL